MKLGLQKKLAAKIAGVGIDKVKFNPDNLKDIKEALTKSDIRRLIKEGTIKIEQPNNASRFHARKIKIQKRKGRRTGPGSRKGKKTARKPRKRVWIDKIRVQRKFLKLLKSKNLLTSKNYRNLYLKSKSGFFRSRRHIKTYITEQGLIKNGKK